MDISRDDSSIFRHLSKNLSKSNLHKFSYSVLCVRVGWVGARALDKEKKSGKNKEKKKARQESEKGVGVEKRM